MWKWDIDEKLAGIDETPKTAKMGRNLIRGGIEDIPIPFYTPVQDFPSVVARMERNHNIDYYTLFFSTHKQLRHYLDTS